MNAISKILLTLVFLSVLACEKELEEADILVYTGDILIRVQEDIDSVKKVLNGGYNVIDGNVTIDGDFDPVALSYFNEIYEISGYLKIWNTNPVNIFDNLRKTKILDILYVEALNTFGSLEETEIISIVGELDEILGFENLVSCSEIAIHNMTKPIKNISGFSSIKSLDKLVMSFHLTEGEELSCFTALDSVGWLETYKVGKNVLPNLKQIGLLYLCKGSIGENGLKSLEKCHQLSFGYLENESLSFGFSDAVVDRLEVVSCNKLRSLKGFSSMTVVEDLTILNCYDLTSLDGLHISDVMDYIRIEENVRLVDFCALKGSEMGWFTCSGNAYNPEWSDIQGEACMSN